MIPKVSILIPCYNSESFIRETISSCLSQTYNNIEIIIVDDGSTDLTLDVLEEYKTDKKIQVFCQTNSGACRARNVAFEHSSGDYIIYLDADDVINPIFVEKHVAILQTAHKDTISFCPWDRFRQSLEEAYFPHLEIYKNYDSAFQLLLDMWTSGSMLQTSCYMTSRQLIMKSGGWNESILKNQDGEFFSRILMLAQNAVFVSEARVYYRTGDYITVSKGNSKKKIASMLDTFILYKKSALAHEDSIQVRRALSINFTLFAYMYGNIYPDLYKKVKNEIKEIGVGYVLKNEPIRVRKICKFIGFDAFMIMRKFFFNR